MERSVRRSLLIAAPLVAALLVVAGCATTTTPAPSAGPSATPVATSLPTGDPAGAAMSEAVDGPFRLVFTLRRDTWRAGEPIDGRARLEIATGGADLVGSGSGLVLFGFRELGGSRRMDPAMTADCAPYRLEAGAPIVTGITKSGGFSAEDPDAVFYRTFFADPLVRLPAGRWEITAVATFVVGACGNPEHTLRAPITVTVEP
jgi:hypothetical protein